MNDAQQILTIILIFAWSILLFYAGHYEGRKWQRLKAPPRPALGKGEDAVPTPVCYCGGKWGPWKKTQANMYDNATGKCVSVGRDVLERACEECHYVERRKLRALS